MLWRNQVNSDNVKNNRPKSQALYSRFLNGLRWRWGAAKRACRIAWPGSYWYAAGQGIPLRENERRLAALHNREAGKRIFILANGPSLNQTDVDRLCGEVTIASNAIFLMFDKKKFRPSYYTIEDYLVAEDRCKEAGSLKGFWKLFPEDVRKFIPTDERTVYINFMRGEYPGFPRFTDNFCRQVYWGGTVSFLNMQLAWYLGASEIYLIGFDHDYARPADKDKVAGVVITSATDDRNHFDPRYFGVGYRWHDPKVERMEEAYVAAKRFFDAHGVYVFNATHGGHLDVFPRVKFAELF
jgi:hypothetical protein